MIVPCCRKVIVVTIFGTRKPGRSHTQRAQARNGKARLGSKNPGPKARVQKPGYRSSGPEARVHKLGSVQEPRSKSPGPEARVQKPGFKSPGPKARVQKPGSKSPGPKAQVQKPGSKSLGPKAWVQKPSGVWWGLAGRTPAVLNNKRMLHVHSCLLNFNRLAAWGTVSCHGQND